MTVAEPASGANSVASMRSSVVLPAPFGPRMAKIIPRGTSEVDAVDRAGVPNDLTSPRAETARSGSRLQRHGPWWAGYSEIRR